MAEQWLSIVEYARTFAVSDMTVRRRIKNGKLQAVLREGKYYIPLSAGERIIEEEPLFDVPDRLRQKAAAKSPPRSAVLPEIPVQLQSALAAPPSAPALAPTAVYASHSVLASPSPSALTDENFLEDFQRLRLGASTKSLPKQITQHLQRSDNTLVDSQALLQFCEQSMTRISSIERHLQDSFQQRLQNLETQIKLKDGVIVQLKQQVEDLQMLVKLMEQK